MAKLTQDWLTIEPGSGIGQSTVKNSAGRHTGRETRYGRIEVSTTDGQQKEYVVYQKGLEEFIKFTNSNTSEVAITSYSISKTSGILTLYALTNSKTIKVESLTISDDSSTTDTVEGGLTVTADYAYNSEPSTDDSDTGEVLVWVNPYGATEGPNVFGTASASTGDPGKKAQYYIPIRLNLPFNDTVTYRTFGLKLTDAYGHTAQCIIRQDAGSARLTITSSPWTVPANGGTSSIDVESNIAWGVENSSAYSWIIYQNTTGTGNGAITYTVAAYEGTKDRTATIYVEPSNSSYNEDLTKSYTITQTGASEFIKFVDGNGNALNTLNVANNQASVTVYVKTNSTSYKVDEDSVTDIDNVYSAKYNESESAFKDVATLGNQVYVQVDNVVTKNDSSDSSLLNNAYSSTVSDDSLGLTDSYLVPVRIYFGDNPIIRDRTIVLSATDKANATAKITITQEAGDPNLEVEPEYVWIAQEGGDADVTVKSNTTWTAAINEEGYTTIDSTSMKAVPTSINASAEGERDQKITITSATSVSLKSAPDWVNIGIDSSETYVGHYAFEYNIDSQFTSDGPTQVNARSGEIVFVNEAGTTITVPVTQEGNSESSSEDDEGFTIS